jgi:predicted DNA-binding ribbon-helix-helix protein
MKSLVIKRSVVIAGHKTSVSLEEAFWTGLKQLASGRGVSLSEMISTIDARREHDNLSSAIRLFVLNQYRDTIGAPGALVPRREPGPGLFPLTRAG